MVTERRRWQRQALGDGRVVVLTADGRGRPCRITDAAAGGA